jgi:uncharacterized membrane protein (DUF373 family)
MLKFVDAVERLIVRVLIVLLLIAIVLGTVELARVLITELILPPYLLIDVHTLFDSFGLFLVILIGIELLKSMTVYLLEDRIQAALVVEVAVIALCNKIITLDLKSMSGLSLVGIATLLVGLAATHYVLRPARAARTGRARAGGDTPVAR